MSLDPSQLLKYLNIFTLISLTVMMGALFSKGSGLFQAMNVATNIHAIIGATHQSGFWIAATSVALLPLFFQFVDMTNWQRLVAVKASSEHRVEISLKGIMQYLIESPLSWLLPIFIGLACVQFLHPGPTGDAWQSLLSQLLTQPEPWGSIISALVFVGVVAIFLSTATELLAAIGYACSFDIIPASRKIVDSEFGNATPHVQELADREVKQVGKWAFSIATAVVITAFILADYFLQGGSTLLGFFMSFYAPLIALAPSLVLPIVFGRRSPRTVVLIAVAGGALLGVACGVWSAITPSALGGMVTWLASPVSFTFSWGVYLLGLPFGYSLTAKEA